MRRIIRYLFSGGTAAAVNIGLLFVFTHYAHFHYLVSGVLAFCSAVVVSFLMQKKWTFQDHSQEDTHRKFVIYLTVSTINLVANTLLLYLFTDIFHIHYIVSQVFASGIVAVWSFFIYRKMFKAREELTLN
jgi:putative flippase GtrA